MSAYTCNGKRRSSMAHARHVGFCCGKRLCGNGARSSHRRWHKRQRAKEQFFNADWI